MDFELDVLGHQTILNSYVPIMFAYPVEDESSYATIVATLEDGLRRLSKSFPWVAGQVVSQGAEQNTSLGTLKIVPFEGHVPVVVKDLRREPSFPVFASLRESKFPFSATVMHESILSPRRTNLGVDPDEPCTRPTILVQSTFIKGGLLLTIVGHHTAMDGTGLGQVISLLSKACHNLSFTNEELTSGNMARGNVVPYLDSVDKAASERFIARPPTSERDSTSDTSLSLTPKCTWVYFMFNAPSLAALKVDAAKTVPSNIGFISTDDVLSALVWQSIMRARQPRLSPIEKTTLARAIDVRRLFDLPAIYPGELQINAYSTYAVDDLVQEPLGVIASKLRSQLLDDDRLVYSARALATLLHQATDKQGILMVANLDISSRDLGMSSWVKLNCYELEFNLGLGKPVSVRRPNWTPEVEGLSYFMPRTLDGEIAVAVCMRDEDLERLKRDQVFSKYGQFVG